MISVLPCRSAFSYSRNRELTFWIDVLIDAKPEFACRCSLFAWSTIDTISPNQIECGEDNYSFILTGTNLPAVGQIVDITLDADVGTPFLAGTLDQITATGNISAPDEISFTVANPDVDVDEKIDELVKRFRFTFDDAAVRAARLGGGPPGPGARGGAGSTSGRS